MIDRGLGACQIEIRTGRKGLTGREPVKKPQKKDAPQFPREREIMKNTSPTTRQRSRLLDKRNEGVGVSGQKR